jgi:hypothetical protein
MVKSVINTALLGMLLVGGIPAMAQSASQLSATTGNLTNTDSRTTQINYVETGQNAGTQGAGASNGPDLISTKSSAAGSSGAATDAPLPGTSNAPSYLNWLVVRFQNSEAIPMFAEYEAAIASPFS